MKRKKIAAMDLFCGIGGLTCGLRDAGIDIRAGIDSDAYAYAYEANNDGAKFIGCATHATVKPAT